MIRTLQDLGSGASRHRLLNHWSVRNGKLRQLSPFANKSRFPVLGAPDVPQNLACLTRLHNDRGLTPLLHAGVPPPLVSAITAPEEF